MSPQQASCFSCSLTFEVDASLKVQSLNRGMLDQISAASSDVLGVPYFELLPRVAVDGVDLIAEAMKSGRIQTLTGFRMDCLFGRLEAEIVIKPLRDEQDVVNGASVMVRLAPQCWPHTELVQSQRFINIGKSAISLVHNFRNPLHSIKGAMYYLGRKYAEDPEVAEFAALAEAEIERMEQIISGFLNNSQDKMPLITTDLNRMVKKLEAFNSMRASMGGIKFVTELGQVPPVTVDYFEIEQAVSNVISNAIEAMPDGGVLVVTTFSKRLPEQEHVFLEISDSGPGVCGKPAGMALCNGEKSNARGYGLSITAEAFRRHGGGFKIIGKQQMGTVVRLWLPAATGGERDE